MGKFKRSRQLSRFRPYRLPYGGMGAMTLFNNRNRIASAARAALGGAFSRTATQTKRQTTSGQGVTTQYDQKRIYRKRRMPRFRKRRWRRFVKRVNAVAEKELGTRTVLFNQSTQFQNTTPGNQVIGVAGLYTLRSTLAYNGDLFQISGLENVADQTAALGETIDDTTKYMFHSGVLDLTIRNDSTFTLDGIVFSLDSRAKLELDIYEISVGKTARDATGNFNSISTILEDGETITKTIGGAGTQIRLRNRGATPWDLPAGLAKFNIKVWKKTKYFIPNGDTMTYQIRDPRRHVFQQRELAQSEGCNYPRLTRHLLILAKLVPGLTLGSSANTFQESVYMGITKKYFYKVEGMNDTRDRLIT